MNVTRITTIEEIADKIPGAVRYLMKNGITCIICGEPVWDTLEEAALKKGFSQEEIERFVKGLNNLQEQS